MEKDNIKNIAELLLFRDLITEVYPSGIVSIVSDTFDLWKVLTEYLPRLKKEVLARDGKVVIRPDSGDPADIICGAYNYNPKLPASKGVIELLWEVFGGTINEKGYKVLDPHVGAIYGDSISLQVAKDICQRLKDKGFASQCVFGIGSFTYQFNTRDTFGLAMKATHVVINGESHDIWKDPITDDGTKKSATGLLAVFNMLTGHKNPTYALVDKCSKEQEETGCLQTVFENGNLLKDWTLQEIRDNLNK